MIQLVIDGSEVYLSPDTKIRMEFNSPLNADDGIPGSKTYWFDVPIIDHNRKIFGFADIPHTSGKYKMFDGASISFAGYSLITGKAILREVRGKYRLALTTNSFGQDNKNKKLTDLDYGSPVVLGTTTQDVIDHANAKVAQSYPTTNYNFPMIYNPEFYGDTNSAWSKPSEYPAAHFPFVNSYAPAENTFRKNYLFTPETDEDVPDGIGNFFTLSPQVYLQFILNNIFNGYNLIGQFITQSDYQQLMIYNNDALDDNEEEYSGKGDSSYYISGWYIAFLNYNSKSKLNFDGIYLTISHVGLHKFKFHLDVSDSNLQGPYYLTINYKDSIAIEGYVINPDSSPFIVDWEITHYFNNDDLNEILEFTFSAGHTGNDTITFNESTISIINYSQENLNRFAKQIDPANHVPQMEISEFLNNLKDLFGLAYYFNNQANQIQFFLKKDLNNTGYEDITDLIDPEMEFRLNEKTNNKLLIDFQDDEFTEKNFRRYGKYNLADTVNAYNSAPDPISIKDVLKVLSENSIYKVEKDLDYGNVWKFFTDIAQSLELQSDGKTRKKEIKLAPLLMHNIFYKGSRYIPSIFCVPKIKQRGYSVIYNSDEEKDDAVRILNWIGMTNYNLFGTDHDYPFATSGQYDPKGNKVASFSMFLNGSEGLAETFHRSWEDFMSFTEEVRALGNENMNIRHLMKLIRVISLPQNDIPANQKRWLYINSIKYLPVKMDVEISMQGIETVELRMYKKAY